MGLLSTCLKRHRSLASNDSGVLQLPAGSAIIVDEPIGSTSKWNYIPTSFVYLRGVLDLHTVSPSHE